MSTAEAAVDRSNGSVKAVTHNQVNKERKLKFTLSFTPEAARAIESVALVLGYDSPEDFCEQAVEKEVKAQIGGVRRHSKAKQ